MSLYHDLVRHFATDELRIKNLEDTYYMSNSNAVKLLQKIKNVEKQRSWGDHRKNSMIRKNLRLKYGTAKSKYLNT